jgi:hypothetical protein
MIKIEDLEVYFPFEPYEIQIKLMKTVIKTLNSNESNSMI